MACIIMTVITSCSIQFNENLLLLLVVYNSTKLKELNEIAVKKIQSFQKSYASRESVSESTSENKFVTVKCKNAPN